jgi:Thiamine pyrophosphate enzyme, N-terminal TPP binding domain
VIIPASRLKAGDLTLMRKFRSIRQIGKTSLSRRPLAVDFPGVMPLCFSPARRINRNLGGIVMGERSGASNGAELLVQCLEAQGVRYVFGVPGGAVLPIFEVLADHGPRFVVCRDETGAAFMAQAWGRITGQPGVVLTTSGPGLINAVCGVATATEDRDPVVIITGQVPRAMQFKQSHMNLDSVSLFAPITKWSVEVEDPDTLP